MLSLNIFTVLIKANYIDMVIGFIFKLASFKINIIFIFNTLIKYLPHNGFRRIYR